MSAFFVMLFGDFSLEITSHGNIPIRSLPIKVDVVGLSESGNWNSTRLSSSVLRDQSHHLLGYGSVLRNQLISSCVKCHLLFNGHCIFLCGMVVPLIGLFL